MKIAICDDDEQMLSRIRQLVDQYFGMGFTKCPIEVQHYLNSVKLLSHIESGQYFDVFILDVIMPNINGMQLATEIRKKNQHAKIIFLTSSAEYAVDSYSVQAYNYLLKPVEKDKLYTVLDKLCAEENTEIPRSIVVKTHDGLSKLLFNEILYVEVILRVVRFYHKNGLISQSTSTISQIEAHLSIDLRFVKTHRSYIVNLDFVKNMTQNGFILTNDVFVPISRNVYKEIKKAFIQHSFATIPQVGQIR